MADKKLADGEIQEQRRECLCKLTKFVGAAGVAAAVCPHAGCVPNAQPGGLGWICPCHGSEFDTSGRVTRGPATANLAIPDYAFHSDGQIVRIGTKEA